MPAKRKRICFLCHKVGITITFENGNQLKKHVKLRHPRTSAQIQADKASLRKYRRDVLLAQARLRY